MRLGGKVREDGEPQAPGPQSGEACLDAGEEPDIGEVRFEAAVYRGFRANAGFFRVPSPVAGRELGLQPPEAFEV